MGTSTSTLPRRRGAWQTSPKAQRLTRFALKHLWRPVGSGVMPKEEVGFLVKYLFEGDAGGAMAARIDRRVDRLPGQADCISSTRAVTKLSRLQIAA